MAHGSAEGGVEWTAICSASSLLRHTEKDTASVFQSEPAMKDGNSPRVTGRNKCALSFLTRCGRSETAATA
jgi:hypothetical protein